jgi:hypothetical protein
MKTFLWIPLLGMTGWLVQPAQAVPAVSPQLMARLDGIEALCGRVMPKGRDRLHDGMTAMFGSFDRRAMQAARNTPEYRATYQSMLAEYTETDKGTLPELCDKIVESAAEE